MELSKAAIAPGGHRRKVWRCAGAIQSESFILVLGWGKAPALLHSLRQSRLRKGFVRKRNM
eukprot:9596305-Prorocentrum_lima.AAC.1